MLLNTIDKSGNQDGTFLIFIQDDLDGAYLGALPWSWCARRALKAQCIQSVMERLVAERTVHFLATVDQEK